MGLSSDGEACMRRALDLAKRGLEHVSPNPMVGAVLVKGGRVIAEGWHRAWGGPHAEREAIRAAGDARGSELYVTLEPCAHRGKTPPCTDAILDAGIRRVHYAVADPNPLTAGKGPRLLAARGIECRKGLLEREALELNAPFFRWVTTGLPWVIAKWAMTLDGKIATPRGESRWITGSAARAHAHGLRRRSDAILVGTETALRDDPLLTPRPARGRRPLRIVLDRLGRLPLDLRFLRPMGKWGGPRLYVAGDRVPLRRLRLLEARGLEVLVSASGPRGFRLEPLLRRLGERGVSQLLVEGGPTLTGGLLRAGWIQEVAVYVAPRILGGRDSRGAVEGPAPPDLESTPWLRSLSVEVLGRDLVLSGRLRG